MGVVAKIDELAAKIGALANATGREIEQVFDEIIEHVEGKTPKAGDVADVKKSEEEPPLAPPAAETPPPPVEGAAAGAASSTAGEAAGEPIPPAAPVPGASEQ